jgi:hypothetical protein
MARRFAQPEQGLRTTEAEYHVPKLFSNPLIIASIPERRRTGREQVFGSLRCFAEKNFSDYLDQSLP